MGVDLSIITISTNEANELADCLYSVFNNKPCIKFEWIIIDNASEDHTSELIKKNYPQVILLRNERKKGFASNNNLGILSSKGEFILLLNPDTILTAGALDKMIDFMREKKDAGAAGCKLVNPDMSIQLTCRKFPSPLSVFLRWASLLFPKLSIKKLDEYLMADWDHGETMAVDWILGAFLLVRRSAIETVGFLDEKFDPLYYEDVDLCYRLRLAGYKVYYYPEVSVIHRYNRESASSLFNKMTYYHLKNIIRFFWKHRRTHLWRCF